MKQPLSQQLATFNEVAKEIDLNRFYHVEISEFSMRIQGDLSVTGLFDYCETLTEMINTSDKYRYFSGNYKGIDIILI